MISQTLTKRLDEIGRRHRRVTLLVLLIRSLLVAWFGTTIVRAAATLGWQSPSPLTTAALFLLLGAGAFAVGYCPPLDRLGVARLTDRRLQLKDRLATAIEWSQRPTPLVEYLMQDAEQQARFVDPKEVVPFPTPSSVHGVVFIALLLISVALWSVPLPSGLLLRSTPSVASEVVTDDEGEVLRQIAALRDLISQVPTPEARRLDRDLAQLHAGLRDRSIPKDEAVALLKHFERRAQTALNSHATADDASSELGLDRIQELAERLTVVTRQGGARQATGQPGVQPISQGQRELSESEIPPELLEVLRRIGEDSDSPGERSHPGSASSGNPGADQGGKSGEQSTPDALPDQAGGHRGSMPTEASEVGDTRQGQTSESHQTMGSGLPGQADGTAETGREQGDAASPHGTSETGTGSGQSGSFESAGGIRILEHLTGELFEGPIHTGQVHASFGGEEGSASAAAAISQATGQSEGAQAVTREGVPLAYREAVRRYFQSLEPTTSQ